MERQGDKIGSCLLKLVTGSQAGEVLQMVQGKCSTETGSQVSGTVGYSPLGGSLS